MSKNLLATDGECFLYKLFLGAKEADYFYLNLQKQIQWKQQPIKVFGKSINQPRLTAYYADSGVEYKYSGLSLEPLSWTEDLAVLREKIEKFCATQFNALLLNLYRDGADHMGYHSDDEKELCKSTPIVSLSLGATRNFRFKHKQDSDKKCVCVLEHGDLLVMSQETQTKWKHALTKSTKVKSSRINLTFRKIV